MQSKKKQLENILAKVRATHWIKGTYERTTYDTGAAKTCYCLTGLINVEAGLRPSVISGSAHGQGLLADVDAKTEATWSSRWRERRRARQLAKLVWAAIKEREPNTRMKGIEAWNDRNKTTRKDVVEVLELAIEKAS